MENHPQGLAITAFSQRDMGVMAPRFHWNGNAISLESQRHYGRIATPFGLFRTTRLILWLSENVIFVNKLQPIDYHTTAKWLYFRVFGAK